MRLAHLSGLFAAACLSPLLIVGCNKSAPDSSASQATPPPAAAPAATPAPLPAVTDAAVVGKWKVSAIQGDTTSQAWGMINDLKKGTTFNIKPDHTFRESSDAAVGIKGFWSLIGGTLGLSHKKNGDPYTTLTADGTHLKEVIVDTTVIYEHQAADADQPKYTLTPDQYKTETTKDEKAAMAKYKGVTIEMEGTIRDVMTDYGGDTFLILCGPAQDGPTTAGMFGVQCYTVDPEPYATHAPGQTVKLRGQGFPGGGFGPNLVECEIISAGPSPIINLAASDLAAEYTKDHDAAGKKYENEHGPGKTILLTGPILSVVTADPPGVFLGTDQGKVFCEVKQTAQTSDQLKALTPGQKIKIVGQYSVISYNGWPAYPRLQGCMIVSEH